MLTTGLDEGGQRWNPRPPGPGLSWDDRSTWTNVDMSRLTRNASLALTGIDSSLLLYPLSVDLDQIVRDFARAMEIVDHRAPQASSNRDATRLYQPGIGPFGEDAAVAMTLAEMQASSNAYSGAGKRRYPGSTHVCDLAIGSRPDWAAEVKLARLGRDNGTYEDAAIKKILSPYADDRSAVTDCAKLARSSFAGKLAILIYGFEDASRPLHLLIEAFEAVALRLRCLDPGTKLP
jgi:hypothetical protein